MKKSKRIVALCLVVVTLLTVLAVPASAATRSTTSGFTGYSATTNSITLKWAKENDKHFDRYQIQRYDASAGTWKSIAILEDKNTTSYTVRVFVEAGEHYMYRIKTVTEQKILWWTKVEESDWDYIEAATAPNKSYITQRETSGGRKILVSWNSVKCDGYKIVSYNVYPTGKRTAYGYTYYGEYQNSLVFTNDGKKGTQYVFEVIPYTKTTVNGKIIYNYASSTTSVFVVQ